MQLFKEIVKETVFRLEMPNQKLGAPITLVTISNQNFLINCGSCDASVADHLVPALKKKKLSLSKINYLMFTDCHPECIGGAHKLKQLAPGVRILATSYQAEKLKNPVFHMIERWSDFPDWAPPLREIGGMLASNENVENKDGFECIYPIPAAGHDSSCVCWHVPSCDVLICGGALQGRGAKDHGIACYNDLTAYLETIERIGYLGSGDTGKRFPSILLCNEGIEGISGVTEGEEDCRKALKTCRSAADGYDKFLHNYMRSHGLNSEMIDYHDLVTEYFPKEKRPECLGFAMMTFKAHGRAKQNADA
ncbi:MAG: MBL fold metallo-hydrolase [Ruminococcaceae bacterium]|nr:MBL fold metallo-hydrolase [Oscillospiraceae bacterium]